MYSILKENSLDNVVTVYIYVRDSDEYVDMGAKFEAFLKGLIFLIWRAAIENSDIFIYRYCPLSILLSFT